MGPGRSKITKCRPFQAGTDELISVSLYYVSNGTLYDFGIMLSKFHNAWMRTVAGRLKSDYRYSNTIIYNNFV